MILCALSDLIDPGAKGPFVVESAGERKSVFVVLVDGNLRAFFNSCPHAGAPLEPIPDQYLDITRTEIICSLHAARFDPKSGACLWGPCKGRRLTPLPIHTQDGMVCTGLRPEM